MRPVFVKTDNVERFNAAMTSLARRGAEESCLIVLDGQPGLGKTTTLKHWVAQNSCIYVRAKREWNPNWFLKELLESLRIAPPHSFEKRFGLLLKELGARAMLAANTGKTFALVIDEADHVSANSRILETARDFSDMLLLPVILVGMGKIRDNLTRFPQVSGRVSQYVRFKPASKDEVRKLITELCEVPVADDLVTFTHKVTSGFNREIKDAIANIERHGLRNPPEDEEGVTLADMSGQFLINDRDTGQPIHVPEVL